MATPFEEFLKKFAAQHGVRERAGFKGSMVAELRRADGTVEIVRKDNLIVDAGFELVCDSLGATSGRPAILSHIAVGTGSTSPASGQTALVTELNRQAATYTKLNAKQFKMVASFVAGTGTGAITEAGVFNASSSGTMFDRVTFSVINKGVDDALTITFTFTLS
jgi:hypothetical protein